MAIHDVHTDDVTTATVELTNLSRSVGDVAFTSEQFRMTSFDDRMWYRVDDNKSSTCERCIFKAHPVSVHTGIGGKERDVDRNGSDSSSAFSETFYADLYDEDGAHMTSENLCSSSTVTLVMGVLFALFTIGEILRLTRRVSAQRKRRHNFILFSIHFLLTLLGVSDVTVCLIVAQSSCRYSMRKLSCLVLVVASGIIVPLMTSSFALQSILIAKRRRHRQLTSITSGRDCRNGSSDCYPDVILRLRRSGAVVGGAFLVHAALTIGTDLAEELSRHDVTASRTSRLLDVLLVSQVASSCFAISVMLHHVINNINYVSRSHVCRHRIPITSDSLRSMLTSRRRWLTDGVMLSTAAALGIACCIVRLTNVITSATSGDQRRVVRFRHPVKSAETDWWILVELAFAVVMETTTWRLPVRRTVSRRYSVDRKPRSPETESNVRRIDNATRRESNDARKRLAIFSPLRRLGERFKSSWWLRRPAGVSHIKQERSSMSEHCFEHHACRQTVRRINNQRHDGQDEECEPHLQHQWSSWQRMIPANFSVMASRGIWNSANDGRSSASTTNAVSRRYVSVGDFDDVRVAGSGRIIRRKRPTSAVLINDGGFIRFRKDGDPDGLPISISSDDEENNGLVCNYSDADSELYGDETKSHGTPISGTDKKQQLHHHQLLFKSVLKTSGSISRRQASYPSLSTAQPQFDVSRLSTVDGSAAGDVRSTRENRRLPRFLRTNTNQYRPISLHSTETTVDVITDDISEFMIPSMDLAESIDRALDTCGSH